MEELTATSPSTTRYELRFRSLFVPGRGYAFPCSPEGRVDVDALSPHARESLLRARAVVGRELTDPVVVPCAPESR